MQEGQVQAAGAILSSYCIQSVDTKEFFEYFDLPDTFRSWFLVSELHVYMICNRLMVGQLHDASRVKHCLMKALWEDVMERVKLLADIPTKKRKEYIMDLNFEFQVNSSYQFHPKNYLYPFIYASIILNHLVKCLHCMSGCQTGP